MNPADIRSRLLGYWGPQFQPRRIDNRFSMAMARTYVTPADTTAWATPTAADIKASLRRARDTAPGPDGIPYTGWRNAGPRAHAVLARLLTHMTATSMALAHFSDAIALFLPKATEATDPPCGGQGARRPENTRPLALKNTDCKTASATINYPIRNIMRTWMVEQQRGFVATRGPLQHVVCLETTARILTMESMECEWDGGDIECSDDADDDDDDANDDDAHPQHDGDHDTGQHDTHPHSHPHPPAQATPLATRPTAFRDEAPALQQRPSGRHT